MLGSQTDYISSGGGGWGGFGGGFGSGFAGGVVGGLFSRMFNNFGNGNFGGNLVELAELQNQMSNMRHDISEESYKNVSNMLNQTMSLMSELSNGRYDNAKLAYETMARLQACCCETQGVIRDGNFKLETSILNQGWANQLANCQQTNTLSNQIKDTAFATQLRDLECCCETNKKLEAIACEVKFQGVETRAHFDKKFDHDKIERLEREVAAMREHQNTEKIIGNLTNKLNRGFQNNTNAILDFWNVDSDATPKPTFANGFSPIF